jgi:SpoVK/Ycf46/Vps4 family AAA+-type ATPase
VCSDERLSPAIAERAARTTRLTGASPGKAAAHTLDRVIHGMLDAQGPARTAGVPLEPAPYDLSYVRASTDLEQIAAGVVRRGRGTVCLYGPPGTGKTAFARHLAERASKPLLAYRASDLLGMFVGENEKKMAAMFRRARADQAVLLLDEADGFLRERTLARHGWEVTQVNELLVQMEAFEGIFLCSTNLFDSLDQAALRRFDLKVRLDPLDQAQRVRLFQATLAAAGCVELDDAGGAARELAQLEGLTPGDYATVVRRALVLAEPLDAGRLLAGLRDERKVKKQGSGRRVGFAGHAGGET